MCHSFHGEGLNRTGTPAFCSTVKWPATISRKLLSLVFCVVPLVVRSVMLGILVLSLRIACRTSTSYWVWNYSSGRTGIEGLLRCEPCHNQPTSIPVINNLLIGYACITECPIVHQYPDVFSSICLYRRNIVTTAITACRITIPPIGYTAQKLFYYLNCSVNWSGIEEPH